MIVVSMSEVISKVSASGNPWFSKQVMGKYRSRTGSRAFLNERTGVVWFVTSDEHNGTEVPRVYTIRYVSGWNSLDNDNLSVETWGEFTNQEHATELAMDLAITGHGGASRIL